MGQIKWLTSLTGDRHVTIANKAYSFDGIHDRCIRVENSIHYKITKLQ